MKRELEEAGIGNGDLVRITSTYGNSYETAFDYMDPVTGSLHWNGWPV